MDDVHYIFQWAEYMFHFYEVLGEFSLVPIFVVSKCSWNSILKGLPFCPVYFILQSG